MLVPTFTVKTPNATLEIDVYIRQCGGDYPCWYVGIAADPRARLFSDHNVREKGDAWIFRGYPSHLAARAAERFFLSRGCKGGPGGGDEHSRFLYAYRRGPHTIE